MNNIGELTTFRRLMDKEAVIIIPKVQRDYAYGRQEEKVQSILNGMLDTMLVAVKENKQEIFDFVYGGSYVKKNDDASGLIPLDGQQRLTTLFLLHFVASVVQPGVSSDDVSWLKKFRYETRQSATDFCDALIGEIRDDIIERRAKENLSIRTLIEDNPKYLASYNTDPTISSMLNVIDVIEDKLKDAGIDEIWTALNTQDNILFYSLSLDKFGLDDDLYIKMNSRGKKLTEFEIFKSDFEKAVKRISGDLKDEISKKIDNQWMDVVWKYAQSSGAENIVLKADEGYMQLFKNIMRLELFRRQIEGKQNRQASISEIVTDADSVKQLISYFDTISRIDTTEGIDKNWEKYFYFSDEILGKPGLTRLYWAKKNHKPIVHLAMDGDLSMPELTWFYALYLIENCTLDQADKARCLRIISNLLTANIRAHSQRYDMLYGFLSDTKEIIDNNGPVAGDYKFVSTAYDEELTKAAILSRGDYDRLQEYENHKYLEGSLMLFIEKYMGIAPDTTALFKELAHFCEVFDNNAPANFDKLRINLISPGIDYMQYDAWMEKDTSSTRRFFVHEEDDFSKFLIQNKDRRNQPAILDVISQEITSASDLLNYTDKCRQFPIDSWKYYYTKYDKASRADTSYGIYAWDDFENRPLEMVMLNSSYHSPNNIEWLVLNHILVAAVWDDNVKYSLDPHGSQPFVMNETGTTLTITQNGWLVGCKTSEVMDKISDRDLYSIELQSEEDGTYLVNFKNTDCGLDYIDLAKQLISDIEEAYESLKSSEDTETTETENIQNDDNGND